MMRLRGRKIMISRIIFKLEENNDEDFEEEIRFIMFLIIFIIEK
jgi:hypothetical protein